MSTRENIRLIARTSITCQLRIGQNEFNAQCSFMYAKICSHYILQDWDILEKLALSPKSSLQLTSRTRLLQLTLKAPRKKMHLNMSVVVCCKKMPNITDELSIEANSVAPEQTAPIGAV